MDNGSKDPIKILIFSQFIEYIIFSFYYLLWNLIGRRNVDNNIIIYCFTKKLLGVSFEGVVMGAYLLPNLYYIY